MASTVIAPHRHRLTGRARRITIDLDPTDDPTHGQQELAFFNGHRTRGATCRWWRRWRSTTKRNNIWSRSSCGRGTVQPSTARAGCCEPCPVSCGRHFSVTPVRVDGGFAGNDWRDVLEAEQVEYVVGLANNPRLERRAGRLPDEAYGLSTYSGRTEHVYGETLSAA